MDWTLLGLLLALAALALLAGAALGYWTASTDLDRERAKVWERGHAAGLDDWRRVDDEMRRGLIPEPYQSNPYERSHDGARRPAGVQRDRGDAGRRA